MVVNSNSSLDSRGHQGFKRVLRHVDSRRAGSRAGTIGFLLTRNGHHVTVVNTANGHRSRALKGVDLLVSCLHTKTSMHACASCNVFVPYQDAHAFPDRPKRRMSVVGFATRNLRNGKLICPLDSFAG